MPQPSPLTISTSSLLRLLKEESSYRSELSSQERRLHGLKEQEGGDEAGMEGNRVWMVRQETQALEETKAVFAPLRERIGDAVGKVEGLLESGGDVGSVEEITRAREAVGKARGGDVGMG